MIINDKPPNTMNPEHRLHPVTMRIFISSSVHVTLSAVGNQRVLLTTLICTCECWIVYATIGGEQYGACNYPKCWQCILPHSHSSWLRYGRCIYLRNFERRQKMKLEECLQYLINEGYVYITSCTAVDARVIQQLSQLGEKHTIHVFVASTKHPIYDSQCSTFVFNNSNKIRVINSLAHIHPSNPLKKAYTIGHLMYTKSTRIDEILRILAIQDIEKLPWE